MDEAHGYAYVAEFTGGHIQRIRLSDGQKSVVATIASPRGVLVTGDGRFIYVSTDASTITRFDLVRNTHVVVASAGLNGPRYLTWADAGESTILFPQPNPTGTVLKADLTTTPATVTPIAGPTAFAPYSVAVLSSNQLLIACATEVAEVDLTASVYTAAGPVFLGIGFVPADATHLPKGYADTTMDPSYFFQVKDCPFGGTLPLMINWQHARSVGAKLLPGVHRRTHGPLGAADAALRRLPLERPAKPVRAGDDVRGAGRLLPAPLAGADLAQLLAGAATGHNGSAERSQQDQH